MKNRDGEATSYEVERIDELCAQRGWSRYKLAKEMNDNPTNVNNLFHRDSTPSVPTLRRICDAFGITLSQFYQTEGLLVSLTPEQKEILDLYNSLDSQRREILRAYLSGLAAVSMSAAARETEDRQD